MIINDNQHATDLGRKNKEQETLLYAVNEYGDESKLNMIGKTRRFDSSSFIESIPISRILEGTYVIESGGIKNISCGQSALSKYKNIIKLDPKFPFSYFVLASCLKKNDDPSWRRYALTGKEILEMTTRIGGHHSNHDVALRDLQEMLKE
ncbi:MAG: hypothetical protein HYR67_18095 [Bacteroidetes bacterium]|nr:hypothetical protein [Bacteroidota bacterium]